MSKAAESVLKGRASIIVKSVKWLAGRVMKLEPGGPHLKSCKKLRALN